MKKVLSLFLAIVLIVSSNVFAFADNTNSSITQNKTLQTAPIIKYWLELKEGSLYLSKGKTRYLPYELSKNNKENQLIIKQELGSVFLEFIDANNKMRRVNIGNEKNIVLSGNFESVNIQKSSDLVITFTRDTSFKKVTINGICQFDIHSYMQIDELIVNSASLVRVADGAILKKVVSTNKNAKFSSNVKFEFKLLNQNSPTSSIDNGHKPNRPNRPNKPNNDNSTSRPSANKKILKNLINLANNLDKKDYTTQSWNDFELILKDVVAVYENSLANQLQVNQAYQKLNEALNLLVKKESSFAISGEFIPFDVNDEISLNCLANHNSIEDEITVACKLTTLDEKNELVFLDEFSLNKGEEYQYKFYVPETTMPGEYLLTLYANYPVDTYKTQNIEITGTILTDKTLLIEKIQSVELLDKLKYTEESWNNLTKYLQKANAIVNNENATVFEINLILEKLTDAINNLEKIVIDKTLLNKKLQEAEKLLEDNFTTETWEVFANALLNAKNISNDENASKLQVDEALQALTTAIDNLQTKNNSDINISFRLYDAYKKPFDASKMGEIIEVITIDGVRAYSSDFIIYVDGIEKENIKDYKITSKDTGIAQITLRSDYPEWNYFKTNRRAYVKSVAFGETEIEAVLTTNDNEVIKSSCKVIVSKPISKTKLINKITEAEKLIEKDYTIETWVIFAESLKNAKQIKDNANVSQNDIDNALNSLTEAMSGLKKANTEIVITAEYMDGSYGYDPEAKPVTIMFGDVSSDITGYVALQLGEHTSTADSFGNYAMLNFENLGILEFEKLLKANNEKITAKIYDDNKLTNLVKSIEITVNLHSDKTALLSKIEEAETLIQSNYTADTWGIFAKALAEAKKQVKLDVEQTDVDTILNSLTDAINSLKENSSESSDIVDVTLTYYENWLNPDIVDLSLTDLKDCVSSATQYKVKLGGKTSSQDNIAGDYGVSIDFSITDFEALLSQQGYVIVQLIMENGDLEKEIKVIPVLEQ